jgi:RIO kinase 1
MCQGLLVDFIPNLFKDYQLLIFLMRRQREEFKTMHSVFDEFTNRNIFKLISEGYFKGLIGPVSVGKEANIFAAQTVDSKVIVKIYRLETCDFNRMYDYLKYDPRYTVLKKKRRQIIFSWAQREYRNLLIARDAGIRVPTPITVKHNILVMEFIGDKAAAPKLKDSYPKNPKRFAEEIFDYMSKLYKVGFVHADLSAFNILNWNEKPVLIDFSGCTSLKNPMAEEFLVRDVKNVVDFCNKIGLKLNAELVLKEVKG